MTQRVVQAKVKRVRTVKHPFVPTGCWYVDQFIYGYLGFRNTLPQLVSHGSKGTIRLANEERKESKAAPSSSRRDQ